MIEALSCGTPVVAFRGGSVDEVIDDGVTGFIVEDVESAIDAARRSEHLDRGDCRRAFDTRFTGARMADNYVRVYARLLAGCAD